MATASAITRFLGREQNTWYINKSGGGFTYQPFGTDATDFEAPGDFDGDGKGDIRLAKTRSTGIGLTALTEHLRACTSVQMETKPWAAIMTAMV